jgi:hypothetical protein
MELRESEFARTMAREFAVLAVAAVGAYLFFIHGSLYLQAGSAARPLSLEGFLLVTAIVYLFLRLIFVVAGLYYPRARSEVGVCPECGRALDPASPEHAPRHARTSLPPRPTEKEVLAAVLLRKAIDDARRSARKDLSGPGPDMIRVPGDIENAPVPVEEFERILRQLDSRGEMRDPGGRRPKGPA